MHTATRENNGARADPNENLTRQPQSQPRALRKRVSGGVQVQVDGDTGTAKSRTSAKGVRAVSRPS